MSGVVNFGEKAARRLMDATRYVESLPRNEAFGTRSENRRVLVRRAIVVEHTYTDGDGDEQTSDRITGATAERAGFGFVELYDRHPTTGDYTRTKGPDGADLPPVKVWNDWTGSVAAGKVCKVTPTGLDWDLDGSDC